MSEDAQERWVVGTTGCFLFVCALGRGGCCCWYSAVPVLYFTLFFLNGFQTEAFSRRELSSSIAFLSEMPTRISTANTGPH